MVRVPHLAWLALLLTMSACGGVVVVPVDAPVGGRTEPVALWQDSSIFQLVGRLMGSAHVRVLVEMYELERPDILHALRDAKQRGVDVKVITDPTVVVSRHATESLDRFGVPERAYPVDDRRHQIDHVKLLIADDLAAVGGMNWGAHSDRNHDYVLETHSRPEVDRLTAIFNQDWDFSGGRPAPLPDTAGPTAQIAQTTPHEEIRAMLESALSVSHHVALAEVYTLTDPDVIGGLAAAHRRGVDVRVLLDPNQPYNRHAYDVLVAGGVSVRWYPVPRGTLLHAKIGLFDDSLVLGSANWTLSGLGTNHELDIETHDSRAVLSYESRFDHDWAVSRADQ